MPLRRGATGGSRGPPGRGGTGRRSPPPFLGPPKTPESVRTVPLAAFVVDELAAHLAAFPAGPEGLVLPADEGGRSCARRWTGAGGRPVPRPGVDAGLRPHHLRHGYASWLHAAGEPFKGVTRATHTHRVDAWDRQVRSVLDAAWTAGPADHLRTHEAL